MALRRRHLGLGAFLLTALSACARGAHPEGPALPATAVETPRPEVWQPLLSGPKAPFVLSGVAGDRLNVEVLPARQVGSVQVVSWRWVHVRGRVSFPFDGAPNLMALSPVSVFLLGADAPDDEVLDVVTSTPVYYRASRPVPPQTREDGRYQTVWRLGEEVVVCLGEGPPPDAPACEDVCFAEVCFSSTAGIVAVSGRWAPDSATFAAKGYERFTDRADYVGAGPAGAQ